jgi:membrane protein
LLFAFFGGFAIMIGAELNAAIQEEFPAPTTHAHRLRNWLVGWVARHMRSARSPSTAAANAPIPQNDTVAAEPPG